MKQTSQRSLLFRQNVNRTEAEWVHFLDGYRKALIEFDMKKFGDDWHTAEDIVEEIFLNIVREPRITALRPQGDFGGENAAFSVHWMQSQTPIRFTRGSASE